MIKATVLENGDIKIYEGIDIFVKRAAEKDFLERIKTLECGAVTLVIPEGAKPFFFKTAEIEPGKAMKDVSETIGYIKPDGEKVEYTVMT